jgi:hypothetical protein
VPQADQEKMVEVRRNFFWCVPCCVGFCVILLPEKNLLPLLFYLQEGIFTKQQLTQGHTLLCQVDAKFVTHLARRWVEK